MMSLMGGTLLEKRSAPEIKLSVRGTHQVRQHLAGTGVVMFWVRILHQTDFQHLQSLVYPRLRWDALMKSKASN